MRSARWRSARGRTWRNSPGRAPPSSSIDCCFPATEPTCPVHFRVSPEYHPQAMSYTVLARRYRSNNFDELIGQEHIAQTLKKAIDSGRIAHAYLFCGTRGTGKTSTARILAKCLNREQSDGPTSKPCGKCESCKAIARGDDIDV